MSSSLVSPIHDSDKYHADLDKLAIGPRLDYAVGDNARQPQT